MFSQDKNIELDAKEDEENMSIYELRKREISYLKWILSVQNRMEAIKKESKQILEGEQSENINHIFQTLCEMENLANEEFRPLYCTSIEANEHICKTLLELLTSNSKKILKQITK